MRYNKKADMSLQKVIGLVLAAIVFLVLFLWSPNIYSMTSEKIGGEKGLISIQTEKLCEMSNGKTFEIANCDSNNFNYICRKEEQDKFDKYIKYLNGKTCPGSGEVGVEKDKACTCVQQKIYDIWKENNQVQNEINTEREIQFKSSNLVSTKTDLNKIYSNNDELIRTFAKENKIQVSKLKAFIQVESGSKPFYSDGHPTVRFECLKFNKNLEESKKVSCSTTQFKYGNAEDTGKDAFLRALKIDKNLAIQKTSFGMGQVMGWDYKMVGYNSEEDFYKAMFIEQNQIKVFLRFITNKNGGIILKELQKENTDWAIVAYNYNGQNYKDNNYDIKLASAEKTFSSSNIG